MVSKVKMVIASLASLLLQGRRGVEVDRLVVVGVLRRLDRLVLVVRAGRSSGSVARQEATGSVWVAGGVLRSVGMGVMELSPLRSRLCFVSGRVRVGGVEEEQTSPLAHDDADNDAHDEQHQTRRNHKSNRHRRSTANCFGLYTTRRVCLWGGLFGCWFAVWRQYGRRLSWRWCRCGCGCWFGVGVGVVGCGVVVVWLVVAAEMGSWDVVLCAPVVVVMIQGVFLMSTPGFLNNFTITKPKIWYTSTRFYQP